MEPHSDAAEISTINYKSGPCVASYEQDRDHLRSYGEPTRSTLGSKLEEQLALYVAATVRNIGELLADGTTDMECKETISLLDKAHVPPEAQRHLGPFDDKAPFAEMPTFHDEPAVFAPRVPTLAELKEINKQINKHRLRPSTQTDGELEDIIENWLPTGPNLDLLLHTSRQKAVSPPPSPPVSPRTSREVPTLGCEKVTDLTIPNQKVGAAPTEAGIDPQAKWSSEGDRSLLEPVFLEETVRAVLLSLRTTPRAHRCRTRLRNYRLQLRERARGVLILGGPVADQMARRGRSASASRRVRRCRCQSATTWRLVKRWT